VDLIPGDKFNDAEDAILCFFLQHYLVNKKQVANFMLGRKLESGKR